jgi:hypothetical protein
MMDFKRINWAYHAAGLAVALWLKNRFFIRKKGAKPLTLDNYPNNSNHWTVFDPFYIFMGASTQ